MHSYYSKINKSGLAEPYHDHTFCWQVPTMHACLKTFAKSTVISLQSYNQTVNSNNSKQVISESIASLHDKSLPNKSLLAHSH